MSLKALIRYYPFCARVNQTNTLKHFGLWMNAKSQTWASSSLPDYGHSAARSLREIECGHGRRANLLMRNDFCDRSNRNIRLDLLTELPYLLWINPLFG